MESRERFVFQQAVAQVKQEAARLTGDRLMAAEARTEETEARLCLTWHDIMDTTWGIRLLCDVRG
jgi:hypothetical protein